MNRPRLTATYRIQLGPDFGFNAAAAIVGYLADLGISHLYLSPIFEARPGSTHGFDQTDPTRIRAELGGEPAFEHLAAVARAHALGIVLDIVPNHMAAHHANEWWFGLLRHGPGSEFDRFFDVDWDSEAGRVILPVLGAPLAEVIAKGELTLEPTIRGGCIRYFDRLFPLRVVPSPGPAAEPLESLLSRQHYTLMYWKDGLKRINYRRFFDVSDLAGIRVEDPLVFERTHAKLFELVERRLIDGVRIDHIDGLRDPLQYLGRLRKGLGSASPGGGPVPLFVEKIFAWGESLPPSWPVDGATGYEFLAASASLMSDAAGICALRDHAVVAGAGARSFRDLAIAGKSEVAQSILEPELLRVCRAAAACMRRAGQVCDSSLLRDAMVSLTACLPEYRTYVDSDGISPEDAARVHNAAGLASTLSDATHGCEPPTQLDDLLTLSGPFRSGAARVGALEVVRSWQQFTGPVAAKGVEDTALYRDVAVPALNDVGSEPVAREPAMLLAWLAEQRRTNPLSLNATDTHDAKRSEDVRARLAVLSVFPHAWTQILDNVISRFSAAASTRPGPRPSPQDLSLLVHSAFALGPTEGVPDVILADRLKAYITKSAREAKRSTSWINPSAPYEAACGQAVDMLLFGEALADVRSAMAQLARATRPLAARLSIAAIMLKALFPGTPDWYQGTECQALSLVDPDNRRPIPFQSHRDLLAAIRSQWSANPTAAAASSLHNPDSDAAKVFSTWRVLAVRRRLLASGHRTDLEAFERSPFRWRWSIRVGQARCVAAVDLPTMPAAEKPPRASLLAHVDQLTARLPGTPPLWASIVVDGVGSLW